MTGPDRTEIEQNRSQENTRLLYEHAIAALHEGLALVEPETMQVVAANGAFARILGRDLDQVVGHFPWEWEVPQGQGELHGTGDLFGQGERDPAGSHESIIRRPDGAHVDVEFNISQVDRDGNPCLFVFCRDITARKAAKRALDRQTLFYRQAMASMCDGVALFKNMNSPVVIECNGAFAHMLGYDSPEEVAGLHPWDWDVNHTREEILAILRQGNKGLDRARVETRHRRRDGSVYDAEVTITNFTMNGETYGYAIVRDVSDVKRTQKEREISELRAQLAVESAGIGIWEREVSSGRITASKEFEAVLDVRSGEMSTEEDWIARVHPDDLSRYHSVMGDRLQGKAENFGIELRMRRSDGSYKWISSFGKVVERDDQGRAMCLIGTVRDIDARKTAEEELRNREELLSEILDHAPGAVLLIDEHTRKIVQFNDHAATMHGYTAEEFSSIEPAFLRVSPTAQELQEWWHRLRRTGEVTLEGMHRRKDGSIFEVQIRSRLIEIGNCRYALTIWTDISELKRTEMELRERQDLLSAVFAHTRGGMLLFDEASWKIVQFSDHAAAMHGYSREEFAQVELSDCKVECLPETIEKRRRHVMTHEEIAFEDIHRRKDGSTFDVQIRANRIQIGGRNYVLALWTDISDLKEAHRELAVQKEEVRSLVEHSPDGMIRYDKELRRVYVNAAMQKFIGSATGKIFGKKIKNPPRLIMPDNYIRALKETFATGQNSGQIEIPYAGDNGEERWGLVNFAVEHDAKGDVATVLMTIRDITALIEHRRQIHHLAFTDDLTGLANRNAFNERFSDILENCRNTGTGAALLVFDLDMFKDINDSLGHAAGDELLRQIGSRLSAEMRRGDVMARLGGDEFAILLPQCSGRLDVRTVIDRIHGAFLAPFDLGQCEVFASATIGVALFPEDGQATDDLFAHADAAMYTAKSVGRGGVQFYTQDLSSEVTRRLALSTDLKSACAAGQLELVYQPKVALSDGACIGAEALLRWRHPVHGLMAPDKFIPLAEETGMIVEMGRWVLLEACRTAAEWNHASDAPFRLAVNLSSRQFIANDIVEDVRNALTETGCRSEWLECEITESLLLNDDESVQEALTEFGRMGVTVAIDDFGTGHSALAYLNRFHVDVLKIDRSFVDNMECDWRKAELVKAFLSLADALEMETVAEGIETSDQMRILNRLGCAIGQGYHFSAPISKTQFQQQFLVQEVKRSKQPPRLTRKKNSVHFL